MATISTSGDLFTQGYDIFQVSGDLFIHGQDNIEASGNLFIEGHIDTSGVSAPSLFIWGHESDSASVNLYVSGLTPFSTWTISPRIDQLLKTHDHNPQIIGLLSSLASGVTIEIWNITSGANTVVTLTNNVCYSIGTTARWGWSIANLLLYRGYKKHYFYRMTSDIGDTFEGQFLLDVPERARWIHPAQQSEYIK